MSVGHEEAEAAFDAEDREALLAVVRDIVRDRIEQRAAEIDRNREFPDDVRRLFSSVGLLGLTIPGRYGGLGAPLDLAVDVIIEIAGACANSANIVTQQALGAAAILTAGSDEQKRRWLPRLAAGEDLAAFALTEPGAGSDNNALVASATRSGDEYVVRGTKVFCTWGSIARVLTVFARAQNDPAGEGLVALVIDLPTSGLVVSRIEEKMGLNGSPTAQLLFEDVRVPVANRLGRPGEGFKIAMRSLNAGRIEIGALALGIANGALRYAGRYLRGRQQFGRPLSEFQGLQFKIADHATAIEAAYRLLVAAARAVDAGDKRHVELAAMAKLFASDTAMATTTDAVGLLGGYGYLKDYPVERMMRDAKVMQIVEGTNEIQRVIIARQWLTSLI